MKNIPYQTTIVQILKIPAILFEMKNAGLDSFFILDCNLLVQFDQRVCELLELWFETINDYDKNEIIKDLHSIINDYKKEIK